jgi:hypothetical protein
MADRRMKTLDRSKHYGVVYGHEFARYVQDGVLFTPDGEQFVDEGAVAPILDVAIEPVDDLNKEPLVAGKAISHKGWPKGKKRK